MLFHEADASGQILTAEFMNKIYADLNEKYYNLKAEDNYEISLSGNVFRIST